MGRRPNTVAIGPNTRIPTASGTGVDAEARNNDSITCTGSHVRALDGAGAATTSGDPEPRRDHEICRDHEVQSGHPHDGSR